MLDSPRQIEAALRRGSQAELTDHLDYLNGAAEASLFSDSPSRTVADYIFQTVKFDR
jgi:hypothetical protein